MSVFNLPILQCTKETEFQEVFNNDLVDSGLKFEGYELKIIADDFYHTCFEKGSGGKEKVKFGIRRARRMMLIKAICEKTVPYILLWQTEREDKTVCVLCEEAETAIYLKARNAKEGKFFIFKTLTVFGSKVESRIRKQKRESVEISDLEEVFKEAD